MNLYLALSTLNLLLGGLVFLLGFIILRENPGQRLNRIVAMMLFFGGLGAVLAALTFMAARGGQAIQAVQVLNNVSYVWEFFFPTLFLFASVFPEERRFVRTLRLRLGPWSLGFTALVFAPHAFHFLLMLATTLWSPDLRLPDVGPLRYLQPLFGVLAIVLGLFLLVHQALFSLVNLGFGVATMLLLFDSNRRTHVRRLKQQLGVVALGLSASLVCYSLATSIPRLFGFDLDEAWTAGLTIAALTLGPGSIAYSVVRYKFLDTKLLARRAILYALVSAVLVGVYLLVVARLNRLVSQVAGLDARVFEPVFLIMALALFQPAVARLEEMLDQVFLRDPGDYRNVVRQLGRELQTTIDLEVLLARTIQTLAEALLLKRAHIVVLTRDGAMAHTGAGTPPAEEDLLFLAEVLPRVSAHQTSYRLTERVEGIAEPEQKELVRRMGVDLIVPLRWSGDLVGALLLGEKITGTDLTSEDVALLTTLAGQVSVSLQNALLLRDRVAVARIEEELNLARQIQRASLLSEFPAMPRSEVHAIYVPARQVGGDFYDVVPEGDGRFLVAIADVSGKGVPAALLSSMLQASLRTQAGTGAAVGEILRSINALLYRSTATQQFATFFLARFDANALRMEFSNAGHNWPVVVRARGEHEFLERGGTVLGILEQARFEEGSVTLEPGDVVVLYTDGVTEATNEDGELFGEARVNQCLQSLPANRTARGIVEHLIVTLRMFLADLEPQDDVTLLVLAAREPVAAGTAPEGRPEVVAAR